MGGRYGAVKKIVVFPLLCRNIDEGVDEMKKDIELIRKMLIIFEDNNDEYYHIAHDKPLEIEQYTEKEIAYNLKNMFSDELVEGDKYIPGLEIVEVVVKPSSKGHDFVKMAKDEGIWSSFKTKTGDKLHTMSIDMIINSLMNFFSNF